jgi:hypothetical protein
MIHSSVSDLEHEPPPLAGAAGANHGAQGPRDAALAADHLADVVLGDMEPEDGLVLPLLLLDPDRVGIVDELPGQVLQ